MNGYISQIDSTLPTLIVEIPHTVGDEVNAVNARELWTKLESKQEFTHWINGRIQKYDFKLGEDYLVDKIIVQVAHQGGFRSVRQFEYLITLDMAKELSMVDNNVGCYAVFLINTLAEIPSPSCNRLIMLMLNWRVPFNTSVTLAAPPK